MGKLATITQVERTSEIDPLLTVKQTASTLGMKEPTIRLWIYQRKLPHVRCGRAVRIPASAVAEFIQKNTVPAK